MHLETDEKETSTTFEKEIPRHVEKDSSKNVETTKLLDEKSRTKKSERTNFVRCVKNVFYEHFLKDIGCSKKSS